MRRGQFIAPAADLPPAAPSRFDGGYVCGYQRSPIRTIFAGAPPMVAVA